MTEEKKEVESSSAEDDKKTDKIQEVSKEELTDDELKLAFKHPRFKELTEKAKELDKIKKERELDEENKLKEQAKFEELANKFKAEKDDLIKKLSDQQKKQSVIAQAIALGVRKEAIDDVVKLIDLESLEVDENNEPKNTLNVVKTLLDNKPYLLSNDGKTNIGSTTTTSEPNKSQFWKFSEIQKKSHDNKWYEENKAEIEKAKLEGRINYKE